MRSQQQAQQQQQQQQSLGMDMPSLQQQQQHHPQQQQPSSMPTATSRLMRRGHQLELLQQAKEQCDRQDFVDLTFYCEDGVVRGHQMVLATASPFLKGLFQTLPTSGQEEAAVILPEVKACLVQALLHFVYTGTVISKESHFYSLMKLVYALNINASIEAESTADKPTTFGAPLMPLSSVESPTKRKLPQQQMLLKQQQQQMIQQALAVATPNPPQTQQQLGQPQAAMFAQLPQQPPGISLPTQPVPPAKMARMSTPSSQQQPQQQQHTGMNPCR